MERILRFAVLPLIAAFFLAIVSPGPLLAGAEAPEALEKLENAILEGDLATAAKAVSKSDGEKTSWSVFAQEAFSVYSAFAAALSAERGGDAASRGRDAALKTPVLEALRRKYSFRLSRAAAIRSSREKNPDPMSHFENMAASEAHNGGDGRSFDEGVADAFSAAAGDEKFMAAFSKRPLLMMMAYSCASAADSEDAALAIKELLAKNAGAETLKKAGFEWMSGATPAGFAVMDIGTGRSFGVGAGAGSSREALKRGRDQTPLKPLGTYGTLVVGDASRSFLIDFDASSVASAAMGADGSCTVVMKNGSGIKFSRSKASEAACRSRQPLRMGPFDFFASEKRAARAFTFSAGDACYEISFEGFQTEGEVRTVLGSFKVM